VGGGGGGGGSEGGRGGDCGVEGEREKTALIASRDLTA